MSRTVEGSQIKLNIHLQLPGGLTMDDVDFTCRFFVKPSRFVSLSKPEMKRIDANNYVALVDTAKTGAGTLWCEVAVTLPDGRMEIERVLTFENTADGLR